MQQFKTENTEYIVEGELGSGGNGIVYRVKDKEGSKYALKTLNNNIFPKNGSKPSGIKAKKIKRFLQEIKIMKSIKNETPGVLNIVESYIPDSLNKNNLPFYVMPIATTINKQLAGQDIHIKISALKKIAETLMNLHNQNIAHRDIKPENLYFYKGEYCFGDFGLATNIEDLGLTGPKEKLGPWTTIAPEMRRDPTNADQYKADVYSLSKTIWILITEKWQGFDGNYSFNDEEISLEKCEQTDTYWSMLHDLLHKATANSPAERPNAQEFYNKYCEWMQIQSNLELASQSEWEFLLREISASKASSLTWRDPNEIADVLKKVSTIKSMNHAFLPQGGGADLIDCNVSYRDEFLELNLDSTITLLKPKALYLEKFDDPQWNYFYLENEDIDVSRVYDYPDDKVVYSEEVIELPSGDFLDPKYLYYEYYEGKPIPKEKREITLGVKGNYVIFPKISDYNKISAAYSAFQTKYDGPNSFRDFIIKLIKAKNWMLKNSEEYKKIQDQKELENKKKQERERIRYLKKFDEEKKELFDNLKKYPLNYEVSSCNMENEALNYYFEIGFFPPNEIEFYLNNELELIQKSNDSSISSFERFIQRDIDVYSYYLFKNVNDAKKMEELMYRNLYSFVSNNEIINDVHIAAKIKRVKQPRHTFSFEELVEVMYKADETKANRLIVNQDGEVKLVESTDDIKWYPFRGEIFAPYTNIIGSHAKYDEHIFMDIYKLTLKGWHDHLVSGGRAGVPDYLPEGLEPKTMREMIREESKKYN